MDTAFTFGKFNQLHVGHIDLFTRALADHDHLVIGISSHGKNEPLEKRVEAIREVAHANGWDDRVHFVYDNNMWSAYAQVGPDCDIFLGEDRERTGVRLASERNTTYVKVKRLTSSTEVRRRLASGEDLSDIIPSYLVPFIKG